MHAEESIFALCEQNADVRHEIGNVKRFLERWTADPDFKEMIASDPYAAVARYGIDVDPEVIRPLYDRDFAIRQLAEVVPEDIPGPVRRYRRFVDEKLRWRDKIRREAAPERPAFRAWRERQMARADLELSSFYNNQIVHVPVSFELNVGCSVGCWFCGVGAKGLAEYYLYDEKNARLWRETLEVVRDVCGAGARYGFCYWATDPLDNPDYERFCADFHEALGLFPQTTTAISMKDPARTRRVLEASRERKCRINRFSVLSLKIFNQIHEHFTADELVFVELVTQNKEADMVKARAGHYRTNSAKSPAILERDQAKLKTSLEQAGIDPGKPEEGLFQPGTTACVTGFLFNMVEKRVKLISPCYASERWPLGYIVFDEGRFENASDLRELLEGMVASNMPEQVSAERPLRFLRDTKLELLEQGFRVSTRAEHVSVQNPKHADFLKELGRSLLEGSRTPGQLALRGLYEFGVPEPRTMATLNQFLSLGLLDEEPRGAHQMIS